VADNKGVMIIGEIVEGKLAPITTELLGGGRKLADALGEDLSAVPSRLGRTRCMSWMTPC